MNLEAHFAPFRANILGIDQDFESPFGSQRLLYADWTASGRMFGPIEKMMSEEIGPFIGNTHTETSVTGTTMTRAYHEALHIIKHHVHAGPQDAIICYGSGMTGVINKFQRILGLRVHEKYREQVTLPPEARPVVFITHMEHHSNQTSWLESVADVQVIVVLNWEGIGIQTRPALFSKFREFFVGQRCRIGCASERVAVGSSSPDLTMSNHRRKQEKSSKQFVRTTSTYIKHCLGENKSALAKLPARPYSSTRAK